MAAPDHARTDQLSRPNEPFGLTSPCSNCPFRSDGAGIPLRRARVREIDRALIRHTFSCHKTTGHDDDGEPVDLPTTMHCAGALILLEKIERPSQMMRIGERLGIYDRHKLNMQAPVYPSFQAMEAAQRQ